MTRRSAPPDERIREDVLTELRAQNALAHLRLTDEQLESLAEAITLNLNYAFAIEWDPQWEGPGAPSR